MTIKFKHLIIKIKNVIFLFFKKYNNINLTQFKLTNSYKKLKPNFFLVHNLCYIFSNNLNATEWTTAYIINENEYVNMWFFLLFSIILSFLLFCLAYLKSLTIMQDKEKLSEYECGFEPFDTATRHPFDVHFYVVGILFLIFDVEIALLFPWVLGISQIGPFGFISMFFVLFVLILGFIYEWRRGALVWPAQ